MDTHTSHEEVVAARALTTIEGGAQCMDHPSLLVGMPSDSELGPVRRSERRAEKPNPELPTKRTHVPAKRYQRGYDLGTDGRFTRAPRKTHRRATKKKECAKAIATPPSSDPEEDETDEPDETDETDVAPPLPTELEQPMLAYTRPLPTGRAVKWTAEEDAMLCDAMQRVLGMDRHGYIEPLRVKAGGWRAVAKAMGFDDLGRAARRCHRRWFYTSPSTKHLATQIRKRHTLVAQQRKHAPCRLRPVRDRNLPQFEDDDKSDSDDDSEDSDEDFDGLRDVFGVEGCDPLFPDLEDVSMQDFGDLCFDDAVVPEAAVEEEEEEEEKGAHVFDDLTTNETLSPECDDDIPVVLNIKTRDRRPAPVKNAILTYTFSSTNLGRICKFEKTHHWTRLLKPDTRVLGSSPVVSPPSQFSTTTAAAAAFAASIAAATRAQKQRARSVPPPRLPPRLPPPPEARAQLTSPPVDAPIPTPETSTPLNATVAPPLVQETMDSYLRICKGLASVDPKTLEEVPSARLLMKEFEDVAMRVVAAATGNNDALLHPSSSPFPLPSTA